MERAKKTASQESRYEEEYQRQFRKAVFESLPHTIDEDHSYLGAFYNIRDDEFEKIVKILRIPMDNLV